MKIYNAPKSTPTQKPNEVSIFLAGSIDMGSAENWQDRLEKDLSQFEDVIIYNPRREDWNSEWVQDPTPGTEFHTQVTWELDHIEKADLVVVYFSDDSKAPITLLEYGRLSTNLDKFVFVYCTPNFYRYGNVKIVADREHIPVFEEYEEFLKYIKQFVVSSIHNQQ